MKKKIEDGKVMSKAVELAEALVDSDEFKQFVVAKDLVEGDDITTNLLYNYSYAENQLSSLIESGENDSEEVELFIDTMHDLRDQIVQNTLISRLAIAQSTFQQLMDQINHVVGKYLDPGLGLDDDEHEDGYNNEHMN